ncbi:MAG: hypothetical protein WAL71_12685 [Terriglobales bacterium]|jgi:hypothetical protein
MDADFSIELGREDPVLDFPWTDPAGALAYFDLKRHPELIAKVEEAEKFPELADFLSKVNSPRSAVESAKCDVWSTTELSAEEEIFNASHKFASYVDLVFSNPQQRSSLPVHESSARRLAELLRRAPEIAASVEVCVRRCFFGDAGDIREGFYFTVYVNGYGGDEGTARKNWAITLKVVEGAILSLHRE